MTDPGVPSVPLTRDGVGPSCVALPDGPWTTITDFLVHRFPAQPRDEWLRRMQRGTVMDEFGAPVTADRPYASRLRVYYYRTLGPERPIPHAAQVLFRDEHLVVVDKPHFLPVVPSGGYLQETVLVRLKRLLGVDTLVPIHRIDRDTAGLVMFSMARSSRDAYHALFRNRAVDKTYEAIAPWRPDLTFPMSRSSRIGPSAHFMQQQEVAGLPNATTHIDVLHADGAWARYRLQPVTGRRHQLRVHMAALGLPIRGDCIYPTLSPEAPPDYTRPLQLLARSIAFTDPLSGQPRYFESLRTLQFPLPDHDAPNATG